MRSSSLAASALVALLASASIACSGGSDGGSVAATDSGVVADTTPADSGVPIDSGAPPDTSGTTETGTDSGTGVDCTGKPDGTDCGGGSVCIKGLCSGSSCGDGYVDTANGEECDDSNAVSGDGCSLCKFDCKSAADCDNGNTCDGAETCNTTTHMCGSGTAPADGTACALSAGGSGTCKAKACVKAGCGNGVVDTGEDCDDNNADDTDGCTKLCKFTCTADADCSDGNKCNGEETCDTGTHRCGAGTAITCSPKTGCTGTCDPGSGACTYPDVDKDGVACDTDCNDADPGVFPGAYECKDGKDNDCRSETVDTSAPSCQCFFDSDRDGYAPAGATTITSSGVCPDGYTRRAPVDAKTTDCAANNASAHPDQAAWFTTSYCKTLVLGGGTCPLASISWDYNCSGAAEQRWTRVSTTSCPGATSSVSCTGRSGWIGSTPACGVSGSYRSCTWNPFALSCSGTETTRKQECH